MNTAHTHSKTFSWWPRVIIAGFVLFAGFIGNFVRLAMQSDVDLVSKDYYKQELVYQDRIDQLTETGKLDQNISIVYSEVGEQVLVGFPAEFTGKRVTGNVHFFRPSDAKLDYDMPLKLVDNNQVFSTEKLDKGLWRIKISAQAEGKNYFTEQTITVK